MHSVPPHAILSECHTCGSICRRWRAVAVVGKPMQPEAAPKDDRYGGMLEGLRHHAQHHQLAFQPQQRQVVCQQVVDADGVKDAIQAPSDGLCTTAQPSSIIRYFPCIALTPP